MIPWGAARASAALLVAQGRYSWGMSVAAAMRQP